MSERDIGEEFLDLNQRWTHIFGKKEAVTYIGSKRGGHGPKFDNLYLNR